MSKPRPETAGVRPGTARPGISSGRGCRGWCRGRRLAKAARQEVRQLRSEPRFGEYPAAAGVTGPRPAVEIDVGAECDDHAAAFSHRADVVLPGAFDLKIEKAEASTIRYGIPRLDEYDAD